MKKTLLCFFLLAALVFAVPAFAQDATKDPDAKIKREMIKKSIENYKGGDCPCPYSQTKTGLFCRGTSAYSKPWSPDPPMCYFRDIDKPMVEAYLKQKAEQKAQTKKKAAPKPKNPTSDKPKSG